MACKSEYFDVPHFFFAALNSTHFDQPHRSGISTPTLEIAATLELSERAFIPHSQPPVAGSVGPVLIVGHWPLGVFGGAQRMRMLTPTRDIAEVQ